MVPHLAAREAHQRLWEFSIATPKRLLQQNLPQTDFDSPIIDYIVVWGSLEYCRII